MSTKNQFALGALAAALALAHAPAWATNGYFMPGYGYRSMGMGGVGIAYGVDALSIGANPANIVNTGMRGDMGMGVMKARRYAKVGNSAAQFDDCPTGTSKTLSCNPGFQFDSASTSNREWFLMPEMGMTMPLTESLHAGVAFLPNGGGSTVYPENFFNFKFGGMPDQPGSGKILGGELMQLLVPVTVGYKINEQHSVGFALDLAAQRFRMYGLQAFQAFSQKYNFTISSDAAHMTDQGYDYSYGAGVKVGYLGNFLDGKLSAGVSYTSRTYMTKFDKYRGLLAEQGDFDIPANYGIGIAFKPKKNLVFAADVNKIEWSSIAALGNRGPGSSVLTGAYPKTAKTNTAIDGIPSVHDASKATGNDDGMGFGWKDQVVYKLGVNWGVNERLQLRAGFNYGKTPIPDDQLTFNTLLPVTTEKHYTVGFTYKASEELEITGTYMLAPMTSQHSPNLRQNVIGAADIGMKQQMLALSLGWVLDPGETNYGDDPMDPISFAGWYFGFGVGGDYGRDWKSASRFESSLAAQGITATQTGSDSADLGVKGYAGYAFNKYLALEGGYAQFNNFTAKGTASTAPAVSAYQTEDNNTWALAVVGTLPLTKDFSVFGKVGGNSWKKTTNTVLHDANGVPTRTATLDRGTDPYYGVGVSYAVLENVRVRGEYERYDLGGPKIDFVSAGLAVNF